VDCRVVATTNRDLWSVEDGSFRQDLLHRLNVVHFHLPPLRERPEDIELLAEHFLAMYAERYNRPGLRLAPAAVAALRAHRWPGNVRELRNVIERGVLLCRGEAVTAADLRLEIKPASAGRADQPVRLGDGFSLPGHLAGIENGLIRRALAESGGVKARAAALLNINRTTLVEKMKTRGIT